MSMPPASPTVASWELALRLRRRREQLAIDVQTITEALGFSRNYWSAVENERRVLAEDKLRAVLELFEFDAEERRELLALRDATKQRGWWTRYSALINEQIQRFYGLEHGAQAISSYSNLLMPGLLQAESYIRALLNSGLPTIRPVEVDQRVEVRLRRQQRLTGADPLQLSALISEAALVQRIGGPDILRDQLNYLIRVMDDYPHVDLRVIPFSATGSGVFGASSFHLLDFASTQLPTLGWYEIVTKTDIIDDEMQVRDLNLTFADAFRRAPSRQASLELIRQRLGELA
jgi:transcriptional regulator with XRE-family HTH domain